MGAHAFQDQVKELAAVTQIQPISVPKGAEVLTLRRVGIVRTVNRIIDRTWKLRAQFILILKDVPDKAKLLREKQSGHVFTESRASLVRIVEQLSVSVLIDGDGDDVSVFLDDLATVWAKKSADDGRFIRRLAKRVREAGEACDAQCIRVRDQAQELLDIISPSPIESAEPMQGPSRNQYDALFSEILAKYPVITAHLGR
ncbi:hypothetical protein MKK68_02285 [Methylobacterium sp. E-016]|uniref:hypothetical protein n=1 Tax=Methylobacterium sp. E-016 TaxID=2836556 RepID=UPI001FB98D53|nr:hypothetical protein [Methylobacterium sp. E-016]MCJ2074488.1 hypothetical protein [Methylobacterium sp. E-016]